MLDLWKEAKLFAQEQHVSLVLPKIVSPQQLFGIETDLYAWELASVVVWIGFLQWKRENGEDFRKEPILQRLNNIERGDAILRYDAEGKPYEPEWPKADYIVGNPPFLGDKKMRRELDTAEHPRYVDDLRELYSGRVSGGGDLVTYWFEKARKQLVAGVVSRAGLIATQGIRGLANRFVLDSIVRDGSIFYAISDHDWLLDGAMVHVSLVAFDGGSESTIILDNAPVERIYANLQSGSNLTLAARLVENAQLAFVGTQKGGAFNLPPDDASRLLRAPLNPNRRPNSDVVLPWMNAYDLTQRNRALYIIDFGTSMSKAEASFYELPFEYLKEKVLPKRSVLRRTNHRDNWWLHAESRPGFRRRLKGKNRYIATPRHSKHRVFAWVDAGTVPDSALIVFPREDDYFFGTLSSRTHEVWARSQGTQVREVESGFRYTPNTTFDTFPFPWPPGHEPQDDPRVQAIAAAAKTLVELRDRWLNPPDIPEEDLKKRTLTNLYNKPPQWLQDAHRTLDEAVFAAYGWPPDLTDQQLLEKLLNLNHERAATQ